MSDDGSDGSPARPVRRRIKRVMVVSSASESDSDESVVALSTRRKRMRVLSDDGASSSSGSDVVARRKRLLPALRDSEAESDSSGWATDRSDTAAAQPHKTASGFTSDSSEGNSDKCSICLLRFKDQQVGTPETCEHIFCLDCITEWSKNVNTCPVDRITFNSIVVRACAGGRVLRTEPVMVVESEPSIEVIIEETPTACEICGSIDSEETMLLCDGCDLGFHMQCLIPPLTEVPPDQWLCSDCGQLLDSINTFELDDMFAGIADLMDPDRGREVQHSSPRANRRASRMSALQPSTSSGRSGQHAPSTSRGTSSRSSNSNNSRTTTRRRTSGTHRRKYKRRRTRAVIIEYELQESGKFPVTKTVKRKLKKKKRKSRPARVPRTAARRAHVRASVRARLHQERSDLAQVCGASSGAQALSISRQRAGIPSLSLFGNPHQLDYFSEEEADVSEGASVAVSAAARPSSAVRAAYRQARRKMSIPSPTPASAAPDILSSILESQTLLHSKRAVMSVTTDGQVDIALRGSGKDKADRVDPSKSSPDSSRKAPSYPGGGGGGAGGGRGWGGGYRGGRVPPAAPGAHYPPPYQPPPRAPHSLARAPHQPYADYSRQPPAPYDDYGDYSDDYDRRRENGGRNFQRGRNSMGGGPWRQQERSRGQPGRHSFGGVDNPVDMRTAPPPSHPLPLPPLPAPPAFQFHKLPSPSPSPSPSPCAARDDEEVNDLVIDTDKYASHDDRYDPTEPTNDEDSGDEEPPPVDPAPPNLHAPLPPPPAPPMLPLPRPPSPPAVLNIISSIDTAAINVPANVLDTAVRQVLEEHRELIAPTSQPREDQSDNDSDGDCPNFSIYSATSVHIASTTGMDRNIEESNTGMRTREDEYKEKVSKRCPITSNTRNPIKIKINTPSLIKRVSLYDEDDEASQEEPQTEKTETIIKPNDDAPKDDVAEDVEMQKETEEQKEDITDDVEAKTDEETAPEMLGTPDEPEEPKTPETPKIPEASKTPEAPIENNEEDADQDKDEEHLEKEEEEELPTPLENGDKTDVEHSEEEQDDSTEKGLQFSPRKDNEDALEKMTESISETEDERSYTPCLDENKSKDNSIEAEKDTLLEGLDTEMISEEEANDMFSDDEKPASPPPQTAADPADDPKKKKKKDKDSKKDGKDKKSKKKNEISFKKLSKSGKERNYRDKDKDKDRDKEKNKKERRSAEERKKRKEKRKDLERYDVRTVVTEKRKRVKDAFGRDISPQRDTSAPPSRSPSTPRRKSMTPRLRSMSPRRRSISPRRRSISLKRRSITPRNRSITPRRRTITPKRRSISLRRRSITPRRRSITPRRRSMSLKRRTITPRRPLSRLGRKSMTPRRKSISPPRRRSTSRGRKRRSTSRRKRRRSASPKPKTKKKKRLLDKAPRRSPSPRRKSPKRKRKRTPTPTPPRVIQEWSPPSVDSRLLSPRTPPPGPSPLPMERPRRHRPDRHRHNIGPSKEVFTSGDNILVSVSFQDQERDRDAGDKRKRREAKRDKRRKRRRAAAENDTNKPVAIIDLERSPFRELTPSPKNVIVLSDSDHNEKENERVAPPPAPQPAPEHAHVGPKTPPEPPAPPVKFSLPPKPQPAPRPNPLSEAVPAAVEEGPATPPDSPDAYDPFEPTRSPSGSPEAAEAPAPQESGASPPHITLEAAQKTNLSADDVIDRRPISPIEKVMALLQSTRDVPPDPPPGDAAPPTESAPPPASSAPAGAPASAPAQAPPPRIVLPEPARSLPPKLFLAKPSPIKSNPVKPMQATKISRLPLPITIPTRRSVDDDSPYSPGSSDFGDLFEPPGGGGGGGGGGVGAGGGGGAGRSKQRDVFDALFGERPRREKRRSAAAKVPVKLRKKGKMQVGVKIDEDNLKILDDLPSSAVEMQVKSKFLKKLNRQERVVEEVKLVLKPHYNHRHVTKEQYKDILRRTVPKICHNKSGEINPTKIQALVEAYVKKVRKKQKLGLA